MDKSVLDEVKIDAIGEIHNITMGSAAVAISNMIDSTVWITTPHVNVCRAKDIVFNNPEQSVNGILFDKDEQSVYVKINYTKGVQGTSLLVLNQGDVQMIVNKMMGLPLAVTDDFEFDEMRISAISEVMNQMMGASATSLSQLLNTVIDISPPEAVVSDDHDTVFKMQNVSPEDYVCSITFDLTIDDVIQSKFITMLSIELANDMAVKLIEVNMGGNYSETVTAEPVISDERIDAIGELQNITMGSAATALSNLLDSKVWITTPKVNIEKASSLTFKELEPSICVKIKYTKGIHGSSVLVLKQSDIQLMINKILGQPLVVSDDFEFDEMNLSAVCEIMNQMMGSAATTLSELINRTIDISTPETVVLNSEDDIFKTASIENSEDVCAISFDLNIDGIMKSRFVTMLSIDLANDMANSMINTYSDSLDVYSNASDNTQNISSEKIPVIPPAENTVYKTPEPVQPVKMTTPEPERSYIADNNVSVHEYHMDSFGDDGDTSFLTNKQYNNLRSLMNVPLDVTIRIGSTQKRMDEVLEFTKGTVIELDTLANEPVDVVVNGNLIAKGNVVVVEDNFAIKITEIVKSNLLDTL